MLGFPSKGNEQSPNTNSKEQQDPFYDMQGKKGRKKDLLFCCLLQDLEDVGDNASMLNDEA